MQTQRPDLSAGTSIREGGIVLKLGSKASAEQFAPGPLLEFSSLAETVGFDSVFVSDHFQPWKHVDGHAPNSLVWLGALGARTAYRFRFGAHLEVRVSERPLRLFANPSRWASE